MRGGSARLNQAHGVNLQRSPSKRSSPPLPICIPSSLRNAAFLAARSFECLGPLFAAKVWPVAAATAASVSGVGTVGDAAHAMPEGDEPEEATAEEEEEGTEAEAALEEDDEGAAAKEDDEEEEEGGASSAVSNCPPDDRRTEAV